MPIQEQPAQPWHNRPTVEVERQLGTSSAGLAHDEANRRLAEYGPNELVAGRKVRWWTILLAQFQNVLLLILIVATVLSAFLGHGLESVVIAVIVLFAVLLGFWQEFRAERAIEALAQMAAPHATVIRDGQEHDLPARELVPGDVVLLVAGNKVPADGRLVETVNLQIEEASLTGESMPADKDAAPLANVELPLGDRKNIVYAGTTVVYGRGRAIVVATGMATEFGRIARMLQEVQESKTPLQQNLDRLGKILAQVALVIVTVIVVLGLIRGKPFMEMLIFGIALAVAVVPEALPAVVTISLALGVQRMIKRNALIRRLPAVETLGSTSVICSDKTGTLTKDEMTVRKLYAAGQTYEISGAGYEPRGKFTLDAAPAEPSPVAGELLRGAVLASDARIAHNVEAGRWEVHGDPTEGALVVAAAKAGQDKADLEVRFPRQHEIPFTSESKRMTTIHAAGDGLVAYSKGAPEVILAACQFQLTERGAVPLAEQQRRPILDVATLLAGEALRILAIARKHDATLENAQREMTFLGLVGMLDPPRPEARQAIEVCQQAGIKVLMITGDHPLTAQAVARELGLLGSGQVVSGANLDEMSDAALARDVENINVFARVSPAHKLRVVTALQQRGHVVAMTGDGVNDAPALKQADIGIAMGITGTDVSKEAAEMTLTDDNFASIVAAVEEGRGIYGNIKKYLMYLLSANVGEIGLMAGASLCGLPMPLTAVQILYVNLATDGLPALALAIDPPEDDLMRRPPRPKGTGIFSPPVVRLMLLGGAWSAIANLSLFVAALYHYGASLEPAAALQRAMTATFVSLVLIQFFKAYSFRSDHLSVLHKPLANPWLNLAILWEAALLLAIVFVPILQAPFETTSLGWWEWLLILFWSHTILPVLEFGKWLERRGWFERSPPVGQVAQLP